MDLQPGVGSEVGRGPVAGAGGSVRSSNADGGEARVPGLGLHGSPQGSRASLASAASHGGLLEDGSGPHHAQTGTSAGSSSGRGAPAGLAGPGAASSEPSSSSSSHVTPAASDTSQQAASPQRAPSAAAGSGRASPVPAHAVAGRDNPPSLAPATSPSYASEAERAVAAVAAQPSRASSSSTSWGEPSYAAEPSQPSQSDSQQQQQQPPQDAGPGTGADGGGGRAPPPPSPGHLGGTHVQPKGPLHESAVQAANEHVRTVWSTGNCLGIRSLPDALSPDFRQRLYDEMLVAAKRERQGSAARRKADLSYGLEGGPLSAPLSVGQKQVARVHPLAGSFTQYEYLPSEYDRAKLMGKFERLRHRLQQVAPQEFVVKATPSAPHGAPAFSEYQYDIEPYNAAEVCRRAEDDVMRSRVLTGPFYPPGSIHRAAILKGRLDEALMGLCRALSADWPAGFLQVFEDRNGSVVASFDKARAVLEGDLTSYMNTLAKASPLVSSYQLLKDASQWGLVDEATQAVFYVMWPPWVRHRHAYSGQQQYDATASGPATAAGRPGPRPGSSGGSSEYGEDPAFRGATVATAAAAEGVGGGGGSGRGTAHSTGSYAYPGAGMGMVRAGGWM